MPPNTLASAARDAARASNGDPEGAAPAASAAPCDSAAPYDAAPYDSAELPLLARPRVLDAVIVAAFVLLSFGLYRELWLHLGDGYLVDSGEDQNLFEWFFAVQAHALAAGHPTLYSDLQNFPAGVNLMANTAMPGLVLPLAPLTLLFGPTVTWAVLLSGGLAATAIAWYWLFSRHVVRSRWAAAVGAGFAVFGPPMISHAHAHPNFTATFLLPVIIGRLLRLRGASGSREVVRGGVLLGLLLGWQVLIGEEPLLIMSTGMAVWTLAWAAVRPRTLLAAARPMLAGLGVAAVVSVLLVGYPLWVQFAGPASYHRLSHGPAGNDLASFGTLPRQSVGGQLLHPGQQVPNPTEQNAFFGWPLLVLLLVAAVWLWREVPARLAAITVLVLGALSLGTPLYLDTVPTSVPGPWLAMAELPLFSSLIEARLTLACLPAMGLLLAMASDRALTRPPSRPPWVALRWLTSRRLWFVALAAGVLPILPVRFDTVPRPAAPVFFSSGDWRQFVGPGRSVLAVPPPDPGNASALHWQVATGFAFPLVEGYFVGPGPGPDRVGIYGADRRPTSLLLAGVLISGQVPPIGAKERATALADLRSWRTDVVVLPGDVYNEAALRTTLDQLLGRGEHRDDVTVWDVHSRTN
ncbi:MAG TPA: glycosyl transferase [Pseudonocardia sp.]|nr:glycosyl transferase [Pseudonocardia sp.]